MANFTINFQANTSGDHYIGWRTYNDAPNTYNVITVNVVAPGIQSQQIEVVGNMYCANDDLGSQDIRYNGYVIAACMDQNDGDGNGVPDLAIMWVVNMIQQIDPCIKTRITCDNVGIDSANAVILGTGYAVGEVITVVEVTPGDEVIAAVLEVGSEAGGAIASITVITPGSYKAIPTLDLTGIGDGNATATATLDATCPILDLSPYDCAAQTNLSDTPTYALPLTEYVDLCADDTTLGGLSAQFVDTVVTDVSGTGNCHCEPCNDVTVAVAGSSGSGKITYQTCWDGSNGLGSTQMITQNVPFGSTVLLGCIIESTLKIDQGDLNAVLGISASTFCT